jgi:hypothetical protein
VSALFAVTRAVVCLHILRRRSRTSAAEALRKRIDDTAIGGVVTTYILAWWTIRSIRVESSRDDLHAGVSEGQAV